MCHMVHTDMAAFYTWSSTCFMLHLEFHVWVTVQSVASVGECIALTVLQYSGLHLWWLPKQCKVLFKMSSCKALAALGLSTLFSLTSLLLMMMAHLTDEANRFR